MSRRNAAQAVELDGVRKLLLPDAVLSKTHRHRHPQSTLQAVVRLSSEARRGVMRDQ
jgi:hypothetical protein